MTKTLSSNITRSIQLMDIEKDDTELFEVPLSQYKVSIIEAAGEISGLTPMESTGPNFTLLDQSFKSRLLEALARTAIFAIVHNIHTFGKESQLDFMDTRSHWLDMETELYPEVKGSPYDKAFSASLKIIKEATEVISGESAGFSFKPIAELWKQIDAAEPELIW